MTYRELLHQLNLLSEENLNYSVKYFDMNSGIALDIEFLPAEEIVKDESGEIKPNLPIIICL